MSIHVSENFHDTMPHALECVSCDLDFILDQDSMYHWLSDEERSRIREIQNLLADLEKR